MAQRQSRPRLYLPTRLYSTSANRLSRDANPLERGEGSQLPFEPPPCFAHERQTYGTSLRAKKLLPLPFSTKNTQRSSVASTIQDLPLDSRLQTVRRSRNLWNKLKLYADDVRNGITGHNGTWEWTTSDRPNLHLPDRHQQAKAIYGLSDWYNMHSRRPREILVNSEPAVQDEVNAQFIVPLEFLIQVNRLRC